jgi:hypothetical protein
MQWYYTVQGRREGPADEAGLEELARRGVIDDTTFVWREGLTNWVPYASVRAPAAAVRPAAPLPPPPSAAPKPAWTVPASRAGSTSKFFYYPVLRSLSDGSVIRRLVVWALKFGAILWLLGGVVALIGILRLALQLPLAGTVGGVLLGLILLATTVCIAQVYWYRAGSVAELEGSAFTVIPIVSILFRTAGETYGTAGIGVGLGACLFMWLSTGNPLSLLGPFGSVLPSLPVDSGFLGGLVILIYAWVASFLFLVFMYFLAEMSVLLADMAMSLRRLVRNADQNADQIEKQKQA